MKKQFLLLTSAIVLLTACNSNEPASTETKNDSGKTVSIVVPDKAHNSKNSLDWAGVYEGTLPCADCEGIKTTITLHKNDSFSIKEAYIDMDKNGFEKKGLLTWDSTSSIVTIDSRKYKVGENLLTALDQEGNIITGNLADHYLLRKK